MKIYLVALTTFFIIDMIWLGLVARQFYAAQIGHLLRADVNWAAALVFYALFIAALSFFVIAPAVETESIRNALIYGAFFGLVTYATYDLTNLATLKDWPLLVTIVDMIWGSVLGASVSAVTVWIVNTYLQ